MTLEELEFASSTSCPTTAGSMRGTTPRRAAVVGRVGSEQTDGMLTTKGLKFCSAATRPRAAAMAASLVPSSATILSAWVDSDQTCKLATFLDDCGDPGEGSLTSARISCCKQELNRGTSESCRLTRLAEVSQCSDGLDSTVSLLLSETRW